MALNTSITEKTPEASATNQASQNCDTPLSDSKAEGAIIDASPSWSPEEETNLVRKYVFKISILILPNLRSLACVYAVYNVNTVY